jgi:uncharacterized membrane protein
VPTLIAIGYPDETTAAAAAAAARAPERDGGVPPEAIAVVSRTRDGGYQVDTNHHAAPGSSAWLMYWGLLFGALLFAPRSRAASGPRLRALLGAVAHEGMDPDGMDPDGMDPDGMDPAVRARLRDLPQPGTSALFLVVDRGGDVALDRLRRFGGTVLTAPLGTRAERLSGSAPAP